MKSILGVTVALFIGLMGFARLYVGAHTMNQIIYGWLLGTWLAFYVHFCLKETIIKHLFFVVEVKVAEESSLFKSYITKATLITIFVYVTQIAAYLIVIETFTPNPEWIQRIYEKCPSI